MEWCPPPAAETLHVTSIHYYYKIIARRLTGMTAKREKTVSRSHWLVMERDGEADRVEVRSFRVTLLMKNHTALQLFVVFNATILYEQLKN